MKFGKDFKKQKVPEWTEAYMDYNGLKRILREFLQYKSAKQPSTPLRVIENRLAMHRTFSGLDLRQCRDDSSKGDIEDQVIVDVDTSQQRDASRKFYKTEFLKKSDDGGNIEVGFFEKLDQELNKVNTFYKDKVEEMMHEACLLNKQMDALIALRIMVVKSQNLDGSDIVAENPLKDNDQGRAITPSGQCTSNDNVQEQQCTSTPEVNEAKPANCGRARLQKEEEEEEDNDHELDPLKILDRVKINNPLESPLSTIKGVFKDSKEDDLSFNKEELRKVEERLRNVFIEFYQKLRLLKHYSDMNLAAFSKILKKYEKITTRRASRSYMKNVDNSYLSSSDEVSALLVRVEASFIKHFSNSNRREGMKSLRPKAKREKHSVTFFSGFFCGCSVALLIAVVLKIQSRKLMNKREGVSYVINIVPLYSLFGYIVLHMLMYASNIYFWRRYRVNYPFIFGLKQGTELSHREVFLLSHGLAVLALAGFLTNLQLDSGADASKYMTVTQLVPLGLIAVVLIIFLCPFNILCRSSRFFFVRSMFHCICAPLYKVTLPDFFLADHLTSQVQAIRCLELYICYYGLGEYSKRKSKCHSHGVYNAFYFVVAVIPYWIRFLQCVRRLCEEKDVNHAYNGLKYMLTIVAVLLRTFCELKKGRRFWMVLALISSAVATIMNTYWDIVIDWGLLRRKSKNPFLRDKLVVSHKSVYFAAMVLNVILRLAWMQLVLEYNLQNQHKVAAATLIACLEIIRRGIWSFFRLENEHLNNVGKFRAFKSVPLPFNYNDADDDKDD